MSSIQPKILVIRGGAIGDFILTLPVFAALRQQFPAAQVEVLGYPHIAQLALAGGLVRRVQSIEARSLAGFFARNGELSAELAEYFSGFALIISYLYDPDEIFKTNVARCTRAQFVAGPHRPEETSEIHATEVFLKPLENAWRSSTPMSRRDWKFPKHLRPRSFPGGGWRCIRAAAANRKTGPKPSGTNCCGSWWMPLR